METIGWVGSLLLAVCGLPQMIDSIKKGKTEGISVYFLWSWYLGEIMTFIYILTRDEISWQLIANYSLNTIFITVIIYFYYFPRDTEKVSKFRYLYIK